MKLSITPALVGVSILFSLSTQASLVGDGIAIKSVGGGFVPTTVVDPGIEYFVDNNNGLWTESIDIRAGSFTYEVQLAPNTNLTYSSQDFIQIYWLDFVDDPISTLITDVALVAGDPSYIESISFTDYAGLNSGYIEIKMDGFIPTGEKRVFTFDIANSSTTIPIPATAWLFASALLGLFGLRRRSD